MKATLVLASAVVLLTACGKEAPPPAKPAATPAPSAVAGVPAECNAYVTAVTTCINKLGKDNASGQSFKQQLESAQAQWAAETDKAQLSSSCQQMEQSFKAVAGSIGC